MTKQRELNRIFRDDEIFLWYMDKSKSRRWSQSRGLYLPSEGDIAASNKNVLFDIDLVKQADEEYLLVAPGEERDFDPCKISGKDIPLEDVQAVFPEQKIMQDDNGIWITTKAGRQLYVHSVEHISVDEAAVDAYFGTKQPPGQYKAAAGAYSPRRSVVRLVRGDGTNAWMLQHEAVHWMEDAGILAKDGD